MKSKPILFSSEMVRAILDGKKTQTRRTITERRSGPCGTHKKSLLDWAWNLMYPNNPFGIKLLSKIDSTVHRVYPPYEAGDQLWVRETFVWEGETKYTDISPIGSFYYKADFPEGDGPTKWKPSIFMPREACRINLDVTEVRVERLHDISEEDAKAEGVADSDMIPKSHKHRYEFRNLWFKINGEDSWESNPWVWVIKFKRIES